MTIHWKNIGRLLADGCTFELKVPAGLYVASLLVAGFFSASLVYSWESDRMRRAAVRAGAAEWRVDDQGKMRFEWRKP